MTLNSLHDVFVDQLGDLYSAERQLVQALPTVASSATAPELREAIQQHLEETQQHVTRLEQVFTELGEPYPTTKTCEGMQGILSEGEHVMQAGGIGPAKDAGIIAAAQRVEHYEIAGYGTAKTMAKELDLSSTIEDLLAATLGEESKADQTLTKIATGGLFRAGVNESALTS
jgi:ferritin-like metal-binding protein YciE